MLKMDRSPPSKRREMLSCCGTALGLLYCPENTSIYTTEEWHNTKQHAQQHLTTVHNGSSEAVSQTGRHTHTRTPTHTHGHLRTLS